MLGSHASVAEAVMLWPCSSSPATQFCLRSHRFLPCAQAERARMLGSYFSDATGTGTRAFYGASACVVAIYTAVGLLAPLITPVCDIPLQQKPAKGRSLVQGLEGGLEDAPNPSYKPDPCRWTRYLVLLGMNKWEADMCTRVILSILMGSIIGFERRRADRPAGIRTMAMVCLGACVFTIDSMFAFVDGTMGWDASRVSAAIPSGVGFLGAASIWKGTQPKRGEGGGQVPEVHGLTTATSVWLSAAIGLLCGGGLYVPALFATCASVVYLRFAPRLDRSPADDGTDTDESAPLKIGGSIIGLPGRNPLTEPLNPKGQEADSTPKRSKPPGERRPSLNV
eukprot:Transcript_23508.p1 GENE.Transcript_23508~~Transcript_23508.p1  ORF type:complete len:370 (-),score=67.91 Transcript_23508:110-1123(-)